MESEYKPLNTLDEEYVGYLPNSQSVEINDDTLVEINDETPLVTSDATKDYYLEKLAQLEELQRNKTCTQLTYKNPVVLYPIISLVVLFLSSLLTILNLEMFNMILLPFKLITGLIMILFFTIILVLVCNFFSKTTTWIFTIIFLLISVIGAPILIYFGLIVLIIIFIFGVSGTTIASIMYYFRDNIDQYINGTSITKLKKEVEVALQEALQEEVLLGTESTLPDEVVVLEDDINDIEELVPQDETVNIETTDATANTLNFTDVVSLDNSVNSSTNVAI